MHTPVDLGLRQGEGGCLSPSDYQATADEQLRAVSALIADNARLRARLEAKDRRISELELRLRGMPWRA